MHPTKEEICNALPHIRHSPKDFGVLHLIVCRPSPDNAERKILEKGTLTPAEGLIGDSWSLRPNSRTITPNPEDQLAIMNTRVIDTFAKTKVRWPLAGDQLYIDMDISFSNLPAGTRLSIGEAIIEITQEPHTGCAKFIERFGIDAMKATTTKDGVELRLRGVYAKVIKHGNIAIGDVIKKLNHGTICPRFTKH